MKLVDLEQKVFIPIVDESKGGVTYEVQMSIAEVFEKFFKGNTPKIVEAVPVVHGRWKAILNPFWDAECSECGYAKKNGWEWGFCPNCGAKMEDKQNKLATGLR